MCRIRIKNFGPIKEGFLENDGWMDIKKVTMFTGNQGSGKSTVAKLISTFMWMEKALNRGDLFLYNPETLKELLDWCGLLSYLKNNTEIAYIGDRYQIIFVNETHSIWADIVVGSKFHVPKIMYVPSERNYFTSIPGTFGISDLPKPLSEFGVELLKSQSALDGITLKLPINNLQFQYRSGNSFVSGKDFELNLLNAASGLQSFIPLYLVSNYLAKKIQNGTRFLGQAISDLSPSQKVKRDFEINRLLSEMDDTINENEQRDKTINEIYNKYHNKCFINIVEEPELNLFPTSQMEILYSLLEFNNMNEGNKLIMTTHSPFLINDLTLSIEANNLLQKIKDAGKEGELNEMVHHIVRKESTVNGVDVAIYEMDEVTGTISLLGNYNGLPSDENKLNEELGSGNELFAELLEIEQQL